MDPLDFPFLNPPAYLMHNLPNGDSQIRNSQAAQTAPTSIPTVSVSSVFRHCEDRLAEERRTWEKFCEEQRHKATQVVVLFSKLQTLQTELRQTLRSLIYAISFLVDLALEPSAIDSPMEAMAIETLCNMTQGPKGSKPDNCPAKVIRAAAWPGENIFDPPNNSNVPQRPANSNLVIINENNFEKAYSKLSSNVREIFSAPSKSTKRKLDSAESNPKRVASAIGRPVSPKQRFDPAPTTPVAMQPNRDWL